MIDDKEKYEKKLAQQRKMRERARLKAIEKQKSKWKEYQEHPEKYYKQKKTTPIRNKQKTARKTKEPYQSIFTEDMTRCYITGDTKNVVPHHIFPGADKTSSELFHFILPLRTDWHTVASYSIHEDRALFVHYQLLCQDYWINTLHKTKKEWLIYFTRWQIEEKVS